VVWEGCRPHSCLLLRGAGQDSTSSLSASECYSPRLVPQARPPGSVRCVFATHRSTSLLEPCLLQVPVGLTIIPRCAQTQGRDLTSCLVLGQRTACCCESEAPGHVGGVWPQETTCVSVCPSVHPSILGTLPGSQAMCLAQERAELLSLSSRNLTRATCVIKNLKLPGGHIKVR
jgi:hypothetical protein